MSPYSITREDAAKDASVVRDALDVLREVGGGINQEATARLHELADSIEGQAKQTKAEVEAASAPAAGDAIEALVTEYHEYSHGYVTKKDLRTLAARVIEAGGQQPGVPVESVRGTARYLRHQGTEHPEGSQARFAYIQAEAILKKLLEAQS